MKKISNSELISILSAQNSRHLDFVEILSEAESSKLHTRPTAHSWNALECIEHLNRYFDYYLPEIEMRVNNGKLNSRNRSFKSGWLGNYFARSMEINQGKIKLMKTFNDKNPLRFGNVREHNISIFRENLNQLNVLINKSEILDLTKTKSSVSISKIIKLRLGDTLRFIINHNERHIQQALKAAELL